MFEVGPQNKLFSRSDLMSPVPRTSESDLTATPDRSEGSIPSSESRSGHVASSHPGDTLNHVEYPSNGLDHVTSRDDDLHRHVQSISNGSLTSPPSVHRTAASISDPMLTEFQRGSHRDSTKSFS